MNFNDFISGNFNLILGSGSLRRKQLLEELGVKFKILLKEVEESYPEHLKCEYVVRYLCEKKSMAYSNSDTGADGILLTADTIVWLNGNSILKPTDEADAVSILQKLSGRTHRVASGVCLRSVHKKHIFHVLTDVTFRKLSIAEIEYYIRKYKPFDKSGSYGIQEWIGYVGIEKINGSYTNVMGLPMKELYEELLKF
jgi:septum formation protein